MAEQFPDDVIVEILCRLPAKTVMRLKLVSKAWHRLISNVCALIFSTAAAAHPSGFLFQCCFRKLFGGLRYFAGYACYPELGDCNGNSDGFLDSYAALLPFTLSSDDDFDCCNGLLLFVRKEEEEEEKPLHHYYVCNPTTKQCVAIPNPLPLTYPFSAALAFDPAKSPHYKVVRFLYKDAKTSCPLNLEIFSSDTGKWVRRRVMLSIELPPPSGRRHGCVRRGIYLEGMLYKLSVVNFLLRFDLDAPSDVAIELPQKNVIDCRGFIGMSGGSLYYANHDESRLMISIWLLEDRCKRDPFWTLRHRISMDYLTSKYPEEHIQGFHFDVYAIHPAADIVFVGIPTMVLTCDLKSNKFEKAFKMNAKFKISAGQHFVHLYSPCYAVLSNFCNNCPVVSRHLL